MAAYKHALLASDSVAVAPFHADAAARFADLRATQRIKSPDAIHLAIATSAQANAFITTDDRLLKLSAPGLPHISDFNTPLP